MADLERVVFDEARTRGEGYRASDTEVALEKFCEGFKTELLPAYLETCNHLLLVRLSRPTMISSERFGNVFGQFQYTRFSLLSMDQQDLERAYLKAVSEKGNQSPPKVDIWSYVHNHMYRGRRREDRLLKAFQGVTDLKMIKNLHLDRFKEEFYFAIFPCKNGGIGMDPFPVHDANLFDHSGGAAHVFVRFNIVPVFSIEGKPVKEDSLGIYHPSVGKEIVEAISSLTRRSGQDAFSYPRPYIGLPQEVRIKEGTPKSNVMGFIRGYVHNHLGTSLT